MARPGNPLGVLTDGLDWSGRSGRAAFVLVTATAALSILTALYAQHQGAAAWSRPVAAVGFVIAAGLTVPAIGLVLRRLNDLGWSGWVIWLGVLPWVGFVVWLVLALRRPAPRRWSRDSDVLRSVGFVLSCGLAICLVSRLVWAPFTVATANMKPTLLVGDTLAVTLGSGLPATGDVVLFRHPVTGSVQVSRVIGLPGDTVQMSGGIVILNGTALSQAPDGSFVEVMQAQGPNGVLPRCANGVVGAGAVCRKDQVTETLPSGRSYGILDIDTAAQDSTAPVTVPADSLFVLGDNRDNSIDSRFDQRAAGVGLVPVQNVIGRARLVIVSAAGRALWQVWTWRGTRILQGVQ